MINMIYIQNVRFYFCVVFFSVSFSSCINDEKDIPIVFIGDSLVRSWDLYYSFPQRVVYNEGISGAKIEDALTWDIKTINRTCVLLIGTNNLSSNNYLSVEFRQDFIDKYKMLLETIESNKIVVISILPRNSVILNDDIKILNNELKKSVENIASVIFLDLFDCFLQDNKQHEEYFSDGLHLTHYGYELLSSELYKVL